MQGGGKSEYSAVVLVTPMHVACFQYTMTVFSIAENKGMRVTRFMRSLRAISA